MYSIQITYHDITTEKVTPTKASRMINRLGSRLPSWVTRGVGRDDDSVQHPPAADIEWGRPKTKQEIDKDDFFAAVENIEVDIGHIVQATADVERISE
jgi:hypothetical protein